MCARRLVFAGALVPLTPTPQLQTSDHDSLALQALEAFWEDPEAFQPPVPKSDGVVLLFSVRLCQCANQFEARHPSAAAPVHLPAHAPQMCADAHADA